MRQCKEIKSKTILSWTAVILWMAMIFTFSAQPATQSAGLSSKVTGTIVLIVGQIMPIKADPLMDIQKAEYLHHLVRKMAHFSVYLILGLLVIRALKQSGVQGKKALALALLLCVAYATSDEIHQLYVPGRSGEIKDVLIDSLGALTGIAGYGMATWRGREGKESFLQNP